jgi:hypothetical protein
MGVDHIPGDGAEMTTVLDIMSLCDMLEEAQITLASAYMYLCRLQDDNSDLEGLCAQVSQSQEMLRNAVRELLSYEIVVPCIELVVEDE